MEDQVFVLVSKSLRVVFCIQGQGSKIAVFDGGYCTECFDCTTVQARKEWKQWARQGLKAVEAVA